jgi:hypothetical protein
MHNWPQIVWLMLVALSSLKAWVRLGEPKKPDTYDMGDVLIGPAFASGCCTKAASLPRWVTRHDHGQAP